MKARPVYKNILHAVIFGTVFALIPPVLFFTLNPDTGCDRLLDDFRFSWVYSNCIGGIAFFVVPKVWVRTCAYPQWIRWVARVTVMFGSCVVGSLVACLIFIALQWQDWNNYAPQFQGSLKLAALLTI